MDKWTLYSPSLVTSVVQRCSCGWTQRSHSIAPHALRRHRGSRSTRSSCVAPMLSYRSSTAEQRLLAHPPQHSVFVAWTAAVVARVGPVCEEQDEYAADQHHDGRDHLEQAGWHVCRVDHLRVALDKSILYSTLSAHSHPHPLEATAHRAHVLVQTIVAEPSLVRVVFRAPLTQRHGASDARGEIPAVVAQ